MQMKMIVQGSCSMEVHFGLYKILINYNYWFSVYLYLLYRWFESLKQILSGATRPTRRGAVFNNVRPRKPQLSRHFRNARLSLALHCFQVLQALLYYILTLSTLISFFYRRHIGCHSQNNEELTSAVNA